MEQSIATSIYPADFQGSVGESSAAQQCGAAGQPVGQYWYSTHCMKATLVGSTTTIVDIAIVVETSTKRGKCNGQRKYYRTYMKYNIQHEYKSTYNHTIETTVVSASGLLTVLYRPPGHHTASYIHNKRMSSSLQCRPFMPYSACMSSNRPFLEH